LRLGLASSSNTKITKDTKTTKSKLRAQRALMGPAAPPQEVAFGVTP
jgi:hypothetical protein